jgi:hypothetical protein
LQMSAAFQLLNARDLIWSRTPDAGLGAAPGEYVLET